MEKFKELLGAPMHRKSVLEDSRRKKKVIQMLYWGVIRVSNKLHTTKSPLWCPYHTSNRHNNNMFISNNLHNNGNKKMPFRNDSSNQGHHEGSLTLYLCLIAIYFRTFKRKDCWPWESWSQPLSHILPGMMLTLIVSFIWEHLAILWKIVMHSIIGCKTQLRLRLPPSLQDTRT